MLKINQLYDSILPIGLRFSAMLAPLVPIFISVALKNENQLAIILSLLVFYSQIIRAGVEHEYIERGEVYLFLREFPSIYIYRSIIFFPILIVYLVLNDIEFHEIHVMSFFLFSLMSVLSSHFLAADKVIKSNIYLMQFPIWIGSICLLLTLKTNNFFIGLCLGSIIGIIVSIKSLFEESKKVNTSNKKFIHESFQQYKLSRRYRIIYSILLSIYSWVLPIQISLELDNQFIIMIFRVLVVVAIPIILFNAIYLKSISKTKKNKFKNFYLLNKLNLIYLLMISVAALFLYFLLPIYEGMPSKEIILIIFLVLTFNAASSPSNSLLIVNGEVIKVAKLSILISIIGLCIYLLFNISFLSLWVLFNFLLSAGVLLMTFRFISLNKDRT